MHMHLRLHHSRATTKRSLIEDDNIWAFKPVEYLHSARQPRSTHLLPPSCVSSSHRPVKMLEASYQFSALQEEDSIRLLNLLPGEPSANLQSRMITARLSDEPVYRALSYVWGSRIPGATIRCDGDAIVITKNCEHALRQMRDKDKVVVLWIDAICINQRDLKERGHQIKNMGRIYKQASSVLIYLGPGEGDDSAMMKRQVSMFSNLLLEPLSRGLTLREVLDVPLQPEVDTQLSTLDFAAWKRTLDLPYWTRAWVIQEVGLATKATLMYSSDEIDWEDLMRAFTWLSDARHSLPIPSGKAVRSSWAGYDRYNRKQFSLRADDLTSDITFLDCLDNARRGREATDPRDMVYAFLEHPNSHRFDANYFLPVELVYYNFAVSCLHEYKNPNVLSYATRSADCKVTDELPSWCPKWNDKGQLPYPFAGLNRSSNYKTAGTTPFQFEVAGPSLKVSGVHLGAIAFATSPISAHHINHDDADPNPEPNPLLEAFQASQSSKNCCSEKYSDSIASFAGATTAGKGLPEVTDAETARRRPEQIASSISKWYRDIEGGGYLAALNRCFFIMPDGYMGLGPPGTRLGDICSVVFGSKWAYVLRSNGDGTYQLVGECYIEGVADGRVIDMLEQGKIQSSPIVLV